MAAITISRQIGSGGDSIAARVCEILEYQYFDKRLMTQVAEEVGLSERELVDYSEDNYTVQNFMDRLLRPGPRTIARIPIEREEALATTSDVITHRPRRHYPFQSAPTEPEEPSPLSVKELDEVYCVSLIRSTIHAAHIAGKVVIVGRGAQAILREAPDVLHVRVEAPTDVRTQRIMEEARVEEDEARRFIMRKDRATAEYLGRFFDIDWENPALYHLVLNTGKLSVEAAAQIIVTGLEYLLADGDS
jgi:CMP/dCMP kinase